ncbi:ComEC/Rec2 family competence protein [Streptomyces sp. ACA25]|uniref:ComEC/Rec2 family competence protein n=1 Tax=Streptomyces sp. ACA25 TaxID=3022596 RepID=UPI002306E12E|nr:ComEC/Rec2 family competence protein [Streptomyces sp. ACA25]MDB1088196.1 ComEC/Rec2 family competence protein [Streptomyces sp. ACA25]
MHAASGHRLGSRSPRQEGPLDLRLVPPALATWAAAAVGLGASARQTAWAVAGCCLAALILLGAARCRPARAGRPVLTAVALALLCAAAGGTVAGLHAASVRSGPLPELAERQAQVTLDLRLTGDPRQGRPAAGSAAQAPPPLLVPAETTSVSTGAGTGTAVRSPVLLIVSGGYAASEETAAEQEEWLRLLPSTELRVRGRLALPASGRGADITAVLRVSQAGPPEVTAPPSSVHRFAGHLRETFREATDGLPEDARAMLPALVVGDTSRIPADLREAVQATDMTHLIVVSGAHLGIVLAVLIGTPGTASLAERRGLAARLGIPLRTTAVLGSGLVLLFVVLCRPGPSVLRAAVCGGIALLAIATGRRRSLLPALAAAALLLVLYDPGLSRSFGFLLSVLATGALLTLAPRWSLALRKRGVPPRLAEALAAAGAAQLVCAPVVTVFAARVSLVAVPANLLAQLAFAPATVLGWAALVIAPLFLPAGTALAWLASWPARWIAAIARTGAALPGAELGWPGGWAGAALLAAVTLAGAFLIRPLLRRPWLVLLCALTVLLAVLRPVPVTQVLTGWPPPGWRLVACDVGQGDGLVLAAGPHTALVIDVGPDPAAMDTCLRELGIRHIPWLVLTHFHADHVAGLPGVLRGRSVGAIQTSTVRDTPGQAEFVDRTAGAAGVPVVRSAPGERRRIGAELSWEVLWPPERAAGYGSNDASVTLLLHTAELTVFLPGDLEPPAQQRLLAEYPELPRVDVMKVAHHGSAYQHPPLLDRLRPRFSLVSCGEDNTYGHPAPSTLEALTSLGSTVLRTDLHGSLAITAHPDGPQAVTRG